LVVSASSSSLLFVLALATRDLRDKSKSLAELLDGALTEVPLYVLDATA
jgi:hypothetical protein